MFQAGMKVIKGLYFDKMNGDPLKYKLIKNKYVLIPSLAIRHMLLQLNTIHGEIVLSVDLHEEILIF